MGIFVMEGGTFIGEGVRFLTFFWFCAGGTFIRVGTLIRHCIVFGFSRPYLRHKSRLRME